MAIKRKIGPSLPTNEEIYITVCRLYWQFKFKAEYISELIGAPLLRYQHEQDGRVWCFSNPIQTVCAIITTEQQSQELAKNPNF